MNYKLNSLRTRVKLLFELAFWKFKKTKEGSLGNMHYKYFFTTYFTIPESFYNDKIILDIGCGPRGSLEWADMARERYGIDPLADQYLKLGAYNHKMQYILGSAEELPFKDGYFDVISSFNSLDHVRDLEKSCSEIRRTLKKGGLFLLIVDIHSKPTFTEPQTIDLDILKELFSGFHILEENKLEEVHRHRIYKNLRSNVALKNNSASRYVLTLKLQKEN